MKAFLLAAGFGTRLRPLTDTTPKCLVPVCGKPLLAWWLSLLSENGVDEVLVNTHYLAEQVRSYISEYNAKNTGLHVTEFYEERLLGSGGTVRANREFAGSGSFFICYADNLTDINLSALAEFHEKKGGVLTMALFRAEHPEACGIAGLSGDSCITSFCEKPQTPASDLANAGVYVADERLFDFIPDGEAVDFGRDVLPRLVGRMYGREMKCYSIDIGTPENYKKAQTEWEEIINQ